MAALPAQSAVFSLEFLGKHINCLNATYATKVFNPCKLKQNMLYEKMYLFAQFAMPSKPNKLICEAYYLKFVNLFIFQQ